jgi:hypothetical protein
MAFQEGSLTEDAKNQVQTHTNAIRQKNKGASFAIEALEKSGSDVEELLNRQHDRYQQAISRFAASFPKKERWLQTPAERDSPASIAKGRMSLHTRRNSERAP